MAGAHEGEANSGLIRLILLALDDGTPADVEALARVVEATEAQIRTALQAIEAYRARVAKEQSPQSDPPIADEASALPQTTQLGPFVLDAILGQGGMGVVYRARQTTFADRTVALKILPAALANRDARFVDRFRREATLAAAIHHPNLAEVYGFEEIGETLCFAMRLVEGPTLHDVLVQLARHHEGPVRPASTEHVRRCVLLGRALADALAEIHARGLVHRDVKPSNVVLERADEDPEAALLARPVLVDFGLLRPAGDSTLTGTATLLGTPAYASQDSMLGRDIDARADVFSLAATLHDLLTSTSPETRAPATVGMPDVRGVNPTVDAQLAAILAMALQEKKELRYEHGGALRDELDRWLRGEVLRALPTRALGRFRLWARRNPARAARVGAAAVLPTLLLAALAAWFVALTVRHTQTARRAAQHEAAGDLLAAAETYRELLPPNAPPRVLWWLRDDVDRAGLYWAVDGPLQPAVQRLLAAEEALARGEVGAPDAVLSQQRAAFRLVEVLLDGRRGSLTAAVERYFVREAGPDRPLAQRVIALDALADYLLVQEPPQRVPEGLIDLLRAMLLVPEAGAAPVDLHAAAIAALGAIRSVEAFSCMVDLLHLDLTEEQSQIARAATFCVYRWLHFDARTGTPPTIGRDLTERLGKVQLERWANGYERQALRFAPGDIHSIAGHLAFWEDDPEVDGPVRRLALSPRMRAATEDARTRLTEAWRGGKDAVGRATSAGPGDPNEEYLITSGRFANVFESVVWHPSPQEDIDRVLATAPPEMDGERNTVRFAKGGKVTLSGTVNAAACRAGTVTDWESEVRDAFLKLTRPGHSLLRVRSRVPPEAKNLRVLVAQMVGARTVVRSTGTVVFRLQLAGAPWRTESIACNNRQHGRTVDPADWPDWQAGSLTAYDIPLHVLADRTEIELVLEYLYGNTTWRIIGVELVWDPPDPTPPDEPK